MVGKTRTRLQGGASAQAFGLRGGFREELRKMNGSDGPFSGSAEEGHSVGRAREASLGQDTV